MRLLLLHLPGYSVLQLYVHYSFFPPKDLAILRTQWARAFVCAPAVAQLCKHETTKCVLMPSLVLRLWQQVPDRKGTRPPKPVMQLPEVLPLDEEDISWAVESGQKTVRPTRFF